MNNRQLIIQALDLIEDRLTTLLPVAVLSKEMGYSLYHFTRLFQAVTGIAPGDYISRRRITEAALDILRMPERSLQDISLDYDFNNYETFTRAFKRMLHTTPTLVRKRRTKSQLPLLPRLYEHDLHQAPMDNIISPQLVDLGEIILQGPLVKINDNYSVISNTWSLLFSKVTTIHKRILPEKYYQLGFWPNDYEDNGFSIMCACELKSSPSIAQNHISHSDTSSKSEIYTDRNRALPIHVLPPARYLKFIHRGRSCDIPSTYKYIYGIWLPKTEYRISIPFELEFYGEGYIGPDNEKSVSEIYIPLEFI
ncbi:helix-turn-helix domain-containing protein [Paenibacillus sp. RS8]|uniref:helix-turn-helix domain-containing protein n=1 Tax=unclassified Paenibacillus TaxID=185978 RepID=UPI0035C0D8C5